MAFAGGASRPGYDWRARRREEQQQRGVVEDTLANAQARRAQMQTRFDAGSPRAQQVMQPRMDQMQDRIDRLQGRLDEGQGADRLGYGWRADRRAAKDAGLYPGDEGDEMAMSGSGGNQGAPGMPRDTMSNYPSRRDSVVSYKNALRGTYGPNGQQQMIGVVPPSGVSADQAARIQQRIQQRMVNGGTGAPGASGAMPDIAMIPNGQITGPAVEQTMAQNGLAAPMTPPAVNAAPAGGAAYSGAPGAPPSAMQQAAANPSATVQQPLAPPYTNGQQPGMPGKGGKPAGLMPGL